VYIDENACHTAPNGIVFTGRAIASVQDMRHVPILTDVAKSHHYGHPRKSLSILNLA
jgi:hypothetical protein